MWQRYKDCNLECDRCKLGTGSIDDFENEMDIKRKVDFSNDKCDRCDLAMELISCSWIFHSHCIGIDFILFIVITLVCKSDHSQSLH